MKAGKDKIYVVIVNYNGWKNCIETVESVLRINYDDFQILVVDNASSDDSVRQLRERFIGLSNDFFELREADVCSYDEMCCADESKIILINAAYNGGFARGNNIAIRYAFKVGDFSYLWLLNSDAVVEKSSLNELLATISKSRDIGSVGSLVLDYENRNSVQNVGSRIDPSSFFRLCKPVVNLNSGSVSASRFLRDFDVDDIMGASLLTRREVLAKVGGLPEEYFLYGEETDWNYQVRRLGYRLVTCVSSKVYHKKGASTGGEGSALVVYYRTRNQFILQKKILSGFKYSIFCLAYTGSKLIKIMSIEPRLRLVVLKGLVDGLLQFSGKKNVS